VGQEDLRTALFDEFDNAVIGSLTNEGDDFILA
jgi:hypothetical protein